MQSRRSFFASLLTAPFAALGAIVAVAREPLRPKRKPRPQEDTPEVAEARRVLKADSDRWWAQQDRERIARAEKLAKEDTDAGRLARAELIVWRADAWR